MYFLCHLTFLLLNVKQVPVPCSLKRLQHYTSLRDQESMGATFIQMAREVQQ